LQIFIHWADYKMTTVRDCSDSYLSLYERTTSPTDRRRLYCDASAASGGGDRRTASNVAYLRLYAANVDLLPRFRVIYTPFSAAGQNLNTELVLDFTISAGTQGFGKIFWLYLKFLTKTNSGKMKKLHFWRFSRNLCPFVNVKIQRSETRFICNTMYTVSQKMSHLVSSMSSRSINWFSKFFH